CEPPPAFINQPNADETLRIFPPDTSIGQSMQQALHRLRRTGPFTPFDSRHRELMDIKSEFRNDSAVTHRRRWRDPLTARTRKGIAIQQRNALDRQRFALAQ